MKYIDEYLGRIFCFLLTVFSKKKNSIPPANSVKNILLIKFWGMGSIILTSPAINAVRANYPEAKIHYLSFLANKEILTLTGNVDDIVSIRLNNPFVFFIDTLKTILKLRKQKIDIVFDFEFFTYYSAIITRLIKTKYSVGFDNHKNNRSRLFSQTVLFNDHIHTRDNFMNLILHISTFGVSHPSRVSTWREKGEENSPLVRAERGSELNNAYIVINPNASKMAYERRLPAAYFVRLIDELSALGKYQIVLTGSIDEKNYVAGIFTALKDNANVTDLSGKLSVSSLVDLINSSVCLITNDSGPLHIASSLNKPVIAFYGPESPVRYGPLSDKQLVFYRAIECSPCMSISNSKTVNCIYSEPLCMTGFDVNEIIAKSKEFLNNL